LILLGGSGRIAGEQRNDQQSRAFRRYPASLAEFEFHVECPYSSELPILNSGSGFMM
jgi:hypothetical protein